MCMGLRPKPGTDRGSSGQAGPLRLASWLHAISFVTPDTLLCWRDTLPASIHTLSLVWLLCTPRGRPRARKSLRRRGVN